jgi:threonine/homoserine efflux transporter RhtA
LEVIVKTIAVLLAVALTVVAIVLLWKVQQQAARLGLVGVFTLLGAGVLALSGARKAEVMMGTVG